MDTQKTKAPLPVGQSSFDRVIEDGSYYVDKTLFVKDLLDKNATVTLCTRPRRFGKTLNQTMLKCFFEDTAPFGGKDTRVLFGGLKIESAGEKYMAHQGKYPVVFLNFKEGKRNTFEWSYTELKNELVREFCRHSFIKEKIVNKEEMELFERLASSKASLNEYSTSLKFLCKCLTNYYGVKPVMLIDEYDVPLENSWFLDFYNEMVNFIRPLMSTALKDNTYLQLAVITGCLRISKESIFTGLNNLDIVSILSEHYGEYFGFTQDEMGVMFNYYGLEDKIQTAKDWYDGYLFGNTEVYNPWSSIKVVSDWIKNKDTFPLPYWVNTSGNDIVRDLINRVDDAAKEELETLMAGGTISKLIHEDITFDDIYNDVDNLWNFLFFTGYLKKVGVSVDHIERIIVEMKIPNKELMIIFENKVLEWFKNRVAQKDFTKFYDAVLGGDAVVVQEELGNFLLDTISCLDGKEDFYHGVMLGVLGGMRNFVAKSNRETGRGRCDIVLKHTSGRGKAVLFEIKWTKKMNEIEKMADEALKQIEKNMYVNELESECYKDVITYGVAFCKKSCEVRRGK